MLIWIHLPQIISVKQEKDFNIILSYFMGRLDFFTWVDKWKIPTNTISIRINSDRSELEGSIMFNASARTQSVESL